MSGRIFVQLDRGETYGFVRGHGSREMVIEANGRPVWATRTRAWGCTYRTACDVIALAESRGFVVTVEHVGQPRPLAPASTPVVTRDEDDPQLALFGGEVA